VRPLGQRTIFLALLVLAGCTHTLEIKNAQMYETTLQLGTVISRPRVAITPFSGSPDELWMFNAIVERLAIDPALAEVRTDYIPRLGQRAGIDPDLILEIRPEAHYRSSGWNFLINWPGFLIFTPAWNGYIYHADIATTAVIRDQDGSALDQVTVPISYDLRHADMDRTIWTGLTWFEVSLLALIGGIYNANVFDRDVIPPLQQQAKDNYANYVISEVQKRIRAVAESLQPAAFPRGAPPETGAPSGGQPSPKLEAP
jgi:hypothetical protein